MRESKGYIQGAAEKGDDANVEKGQGLSEKQKEFCRLRAEGKTMAETERLVGFSKGYGWKLMKKENIKKAIAVQRKPTEKKAEKKQAEKQADGAETPSAQKAEILGFLTEVMRDEEAADLKTRMKAAELLGKRENLFEKKEKPQEKESRIIIVDDLP